MAHKTDDVRRTCPICRSELSNQVVTSPESFFHSNVSQGRTHGKQDGTYSENNPPLTRGRDTAILNEREQSRTLTFVSSDSTAFKDLSNQAARLAEEQKVINDMHKKLCTYPPSVREALRHLVNVPHATMDILKQVTSLSMQECEGKGGGGEGVSTSEESHTETTSQADSQPAECTGSDQGVDVVTGLGRGSGRDLRLREQPKSDAQRHASVGDLPTATTDNYSMLPGLNPFNHSCEELPPGNPERVNDIGECYGSSETSLQTKSTEETSAHSRPQSPIMEETQLDSQHPSLMLKQAWHPHVQNPTVAVGASSVPRPQGQEVNVAATPVSTNSDLPPKGSRKKGGVDATAEPQSKKWSLFSGWSNKKCNSELQPYPMNRKNHGLALIIVIDKFKRNPNHPNTKELAQRQGAEEDVEQLKDIWTFLGYRVRVERNQTAEQIKILFDEIQKDGDPAKTIQEGDDSFVCCLSSHGTWDPVLGRDVVYGANGVRREDGQIVEGALNIRVLAYEKFSPSSCPKLKGQPKMFFTQACRGGKHERTIIVYDPETDLPPEADFLFVYSTAPGRISYRDDVYGSLFFTDLSTSLKKHAHRHDLISIIQSVIQRETEPCEPSNSKEDTATPRQCPNIFSTLCRPVHFSQ